MGRGSKDGDPGRQVASINFGVGVCVAVDFDPSVSVWSRQVRRGQREEP